jgi:hypothetical protein
LADFRIFIYFFHPGRQKTWGEILNKAGKRALGGGAAGAIAMFTQVGALMWMRTTMNYQYRNGGSTSKLDTKSIVIQRRSTTIHDDVSFVALSLLLFFSLLTRAAVVFLFFSECL